MSDYLKMNPNRKVNANEQTKYELRAIISCKDMSLSESDYHSVVRRNIKGERFDVWFDYNKSQEVRITEEVALNDYQPQILIYRLEKRKPTAEVIPVHKTGDDANSAALMK